MFTSITTRKNLFVLATIVAVASSLSIFSIQYSIYTSNEIRKIASDDIASNAQNEAYDLSRIVVNKIDSVTTNLQVLATAPSIQTGQVQGISPLFDAAQYSTEELTEYYMLLDSDGKITSASNIARASYQYNTLWHSEKPPFLIEPQKTASVYYSPIVKSPSDNIERLYISYPIIYSLNEDQDLRGDFRGVIVASIRLDTLGTIMTRELSPIFESDVSLVDISGELIYSMEKSMIGKNIYENPTHLTTPLIKVFSKEQETDVIEFLKTSNARQQAGLMNVDIEGKSLTIASHPLMQNGIHFWTLYVIAPHVFTNNAHALLDQQDNLSIITLVVIGTVSIGLGYLVITWNKRLETIVETRTQELKVANTSLSESNRQLGMANEQLKVHANLQREFVDLAAHELRTPIMPILGMADLLESKFRQANSDEILLKKDDYEIISRNSRRLERLATDILDVSRIETQSLRLKREQFDLYDIIENAVADVTNQFANDKVEYVVKAEKRTYIYADKLKLAQVLSNLLTNAAKFTDSGYIKIVVEKTGLEGNEVIAISVSDTGTGIDAEVWPRLFTKFTNKAGLERSQVGSGLGLYISKGIIEAHGGKIWAQNNKDGKGCTFWITIPMSKDLGFLSFDR